MENILLNDTANIPLRDLLDTKEVKQVWFKFLEGKTSWHRPWALDVLKERCERNLIK